MASTAKDTIVYALATSKLMLRRFTEDLKPEEYLHRTTPKANCVAWLIGHLTLSDRSVAQALGATNLPELPAGFDKRFSRDEGCPQASDFGDTSDLLAIFEKNRDALIATVQGASQEKLDQPSPRVTPMFKSLGEAAAFMGLHAAVHTGQITLIRRSLGRPPVV